MELSLGGLTLSVGPDEELSERERAALAGLGRSEPAAPPALHLELVSQPPFDLAPPADNAPAPAVVAAHGASLRVTHRGFRAQLDPWARSGRLWRAEPDGVGLAIALRVALSAALPLHGGLPLHAAGIVFAGDGLACFGPSGAGKSTLAQCALRAGLSVLSDEQVTLLLDPPRLLGSGFWGALDGPASAATLAPLRALIELDRGPACALTALAPEAALRRLLGVLLVPPHPELWRAALVVASSFTRAVPAWRLAWHPDRPPWEELRARLTPEATHA